MQIIRFSELIEIPWKNGGGITRDISSACVNGTLIWRISMADVEHDGPFSEFYGLVRILTVVRGKGMVLESQDINLQADPRHPVRFDGSTQIRARLKSGASSNLNVMYDPAHCDADVSVVEGLHQEFIAPDRTKDIAVHCIRGTTGLNADTTLQPGDTAMLKGEPTNLTMETGDTALRIRISHHTFSA